MASSPANILASLTEAVKAGFYEFKAFFAQFPLFYGESLYNPVSLQEGGGELIIYYYNHQGREKYSYVDRSGSEGSLLPLIHSLEAAKVAYRLEPVESPKFYGIFKVQGSPFAINSSVGSLIGSKELSQFVTRSTEIKVQCSQ